MTTTSREKPMTGYDYYDSFDAYFDGIDSVDPYEDGVSAFGEGAGLDACPFPSGSADWEDWRDGWFDASEDETEEDAFVADLDWTLYDGEDF